MSKDNHKRFPYVEGSELENMPGAEEGFSSPGGVAMALRTTRENVRHLEQRGLVVGYRVRGPRPWLPSWITTRDPYYGNDYVYYSVSSVREYAARVGREVGGPFPSPPLRVASLQEQGVLESDAELAADPGDEQAQPGIRGVDE